MKMMKNWFPGSVAVLVALLSGCSGTQTFTTAARPGETIAIAAGWQQKLSRNNLTVVFTPESGSPVTYNPGDYRIRTVVQAYPDPVSKLVVADRSGVTYSGAGIPSGSPEEPNPINYNILGTSVTNLVRNNTGNENDWSQTIVYVDLPKPLASGLANVKLKKDGVNILPTGGTDVEVLAGESLRNTFEMSTYGGLGSPIRSAERAPNFVVRLNGPEGVVPHSIQADFTRTLSGTGSAWVTHTRGDITSLSWSDTGGLITVMLTPTNGVTTNNITDFKFYVTGAVTDLTANSLKAYDVSGNLLSGFSVAIENNN